jgi:hypothetical protein
VPNDDPRPLDYHVEKVAPPSVGHIFAGIVLSILLVASAGMGLFLIYFGFAILPTLPQSRAEVSPILFYVFAGLFFAGDVVLFRMANRQFDRRPRQERDV